MKKILLITILCFGVLYSKAQLGTGGMFNPPFAVVNDSIWNNINSAARLWGGEITDNGDGTVHIAAGAGIIKSLESGAEDIPDSINDGQGSTLNYVSWEAVSSLSLTDDAYNYIYLDGTDSTIKATTNFYSISFTQDFTIGRSYRSGTNVTIRLCGTNAWNFNRRLHLFGEEVFPLVRKTGTLQISETGTRQFDITAGVIWAELVNRFSIDAFDGDTENFTYWYQDGGGGWTEVPSQTQIDNTYYDDGSGTLAELTITRYGVHWVFVVHDGSVHVVYGEGNYLAAGATDATLPSSLPGLLNAYATLVGKIIIQKSASSFYSIENISTTSGYISGSTPDHNGLSGLDGGDGTYFGHLGTTQEANYDAAFAHVSSNGSDHSYINQDVTTTGTPEFAYLDVINTSTAFSIKYDGSNYTNFKTTSGGDLSIVPVGNDVTISGGNLTLSQAGSVAYNLEGNTAGSEEINLFDGSADATLGFAGNSTTFRVEVGGTDRLTIDNSGNSAFTGDLTTVTQTNTVLNGAKTASFTHDASSGDIGAYTLSTSGAVTVSIHNLSSGMQGTILLDITTNPSSLTIATYSDAGSTAITQVPLGEALANAAGKATSITYTCAYDGTNTQVYLVYGQEQ